MKIKIEDWICKNVDAIESGDIDSIPFFLELRYVKGLIESTLKQIEENVLSDLSGQPKTVNGFVVSPQKGRAMYKFDHIQEWKILQETLKDVEKRAKMAIGNTIIDDETGEVIPAAIVTFAKESIAVTKAKAKK